MEYRTSEEIHSAKQVDLLTFLRQCAPQELIHVAGNTYCTREHDSLKISNGKWCWFSRGIGGRSALDYLIKVKGTPFTEAVGMILGRAAEMPPVSHIQEDSHQPKEKNLLLPEPVAGRPERVIAYLRGRGIDRPLLEACVNHKLLYESAQYHNAVFIGYDPAGKARYAAIRGTVGAYKGEASGSNKRYAFSFCLPRQPPTVHVFESAIDLLSYATLEHRAGRDWRGDALLSLAGVFQRKREKVLPVALSQFLEDHPSVKTVCLHLDNDAVGRGAAQGIIEALADSPYQVIDEPPTHGKDVNDQLRWELQTKEKEHERKCKSKSFK